MNIKTTFYQRQQGKKDVELEVYATLENELFIGINNHNNIISPHSSIALDRNTAIKLSRILRREIAFLEAEPNETQSEIKQTCFSFDDFWQAYPNKTGKAVCEKKYAKISEKDRQKIKDTISLFVKEKPFDAYIHPHPQTYLNQKRWEDFSEKPKLKITEIKRDDYWSEADYKKDCEKYGIEYTLPNLF